MGHAVALSGVILLAAMSSTASAHFQLLYTPEAALNESRTIPLALVFSHPFNNGYTMSMGEPEAFYVISQRGAEAERRKTDLLEYLEPPQRQQPLTARGRKTDPAEAVSDHQGG